jgi:hypothetical protein
VKVYVANGRFVAADSRGAVYAVADQGLLSRAQPGVAEIESALRSHFGVPVPLILVLDDENGTPVPGVDAQPPGWALARSRVPEEDPAGYDLEDLDDAPVEVISPEQRLLDAFPGAEEVTG